MRVAVLLGEMGFDSQKRIMAGILERARPEKAQVCLFVGDAEDYETHFKYESGEFNIYNLPDFSAYDGVIMAPDTIHSQITVDTIVDRIRKAEIPCVSINVYIEGFMYLKMGNENAIQEIVEHLIVRHGVRDIFHIAGPMGNNDAEERLDAVADTCARYSVPFDESHYAYGNYTNKSGYDVTDRYLQEHDELPDAFVAANDLMAVGAIERLKEDGYRVPDDVIVTGYDHSEYAEMYLTGLTTVSRGEKECGSLAYDLLSGCVRTGIRQETTIISGKAIFSGSCGCENRSAVDMSQLSEVFVSRGLMQNNKLHYLKLLMAEATGLRNYDDFLTSARMFIPLIDPKELYVCIKSEPEEYFIELNNAAENIGHGRSASDYMETTSVVLAWKDGNFLPDRVISTSDLIPPEYISEDQHNFYMILPLHHQEYCFGYVVFGNDQDWMLNDPFLSIFTLTISNALETVYRQDTMRSILSKLDKLSTTDELTGVMNRGGAKEHWPALRKRAEEQGLKTGVIFADLDGLKKVNDRFGHEEGDRYIVMVSEAMKRLPLKDGFVFRYGGDELVAVFNIRSDKETETYIDRIRSAMEAYDRTVPAPYKRSVSIGLHVSENHDLEEMIREADTNMYIEKNAKKAAAADSDR